MDISFSAWKKKKKYTEIKNTIIIFKRFLPKLKKKKK